jgi:predicted amidohydrolase YtcJ
MKYLFLLFFLMSTLSCTKQSADLIVTNAIVYTVNDEFATAEAFAVKDGKFIAVGTTDEITSKYNSKNVIDAKGKAVFPGLYDPHSHFMGLGQMLSQADLVGTTSYKEIIERLKDFEKENLDNQWLVGRGWDQNDWEVKEFPTKELLDEAFPDKPVALTRIDGHALIANSKALQLAKITSGSKVDGGDVILMNGEPTGVLIDNAQGFIRRVIPRAEETEKRAMIQAAEAECFKYGLTTVSDAGLNRDDIELIEKMHEEGSLKIRDYVMVSLGIANLEYYLKKGL